MPRHPTPARMEAFSDGVLAVIITIMVLEFKVPRDPGFAGFRTILPTLGIYAISYALVAIYWVNHHYMVSRLKHVDGLILWTNLLFLFCLSVLPFCTSYLAEHHDDAFSVALYAISLLLDGLAYQLLSLAITRHLRRAAPEPETPRQLVELRAESRKATLSVLLYAVALALSHWHPSLALVCIALVAPLWIVPGFLLTPSAAHA